jgi:hypothetical protein
MPSWSIAINLGAVLVGWAFPQLRSRVSYVCPVCGSKRPDGHATECPWR